MTEPTTVARNFIRQYSKARLRKFLKMVGNGDSGEDIAEYFGVSRERVRQWKNAFGEIVVSYDIDPDVRKLCGLK